VQRADVLAADAAIRLPGTTRMHVPLVASSLAGPIGAGSALRAAQRPFLDSNLPATEPRTIRLLNVDRQTGLDWIAGEHWWRDPRRRGPSRLVRVF
jgi:hypothetical protein